MKFLITMDHSHMTRMKMEILKNRQIMLNKGFLTKIQYKAVNKVDRMGKIGRGKNIQ